MKTWAINLYTSVESRYPRLTKIARYIMSGGTAALVDLAVLYVLTDLAHLWYLLSAIIAYLVAFAVSFTLQKYWTFRDHSVNRVHTQAAAYFVISGINLCINTALVYIFVDVAGLHYIASQVVAAILVAIESYFAYQIFVFRRTPEENEIEAL